MEDPQPVEVMPLEPLKLCLDDLQLVLPMGKIPRLAFPPLRPLPSEHREWCLRWVPDVEPLVVPPPIGVVGGVRRVEDRQ